MVLTRKVDRVGDALDAARGGCPVVVVDDGDAGRHAGLACLDSGAEAVHDSDPSAGQSRDGQAYMVAASVLRALGIEGIRMLGDDPRAVTHLTRHGIRVDATVPLRAPAPPLLAARPA